MAHLDPSIRSCLRGTGSASERIDSTASECIPNTPSPLITPAIAL